MIANVSHATIFILRVTLTRCDTMNAPTSAPDIHAMNQRTELTLLTGVAVTGVVTVILGAALPLLQLKYGVSEAQLGRLFTAQFAGSAIAAALSLRHPRFSIVAGFQFLAIGVAAAGFASWRFAPLAIVIYGVGLGLVIPSANMAVALAHEKTRGASLSILNLAWGIGAVATPLVFFAVRGGNRLSSIYVGAAVLAEAIGIVLWMTFRSFPQPKAVGVSTSGPAFDPRFLPHGLGFLLYIGTEGCVGGWSSEYVFKTFAAPHVATAAIATFWIGLLVGRAAAPAILRRVIEPQLLRLSLAFSLLGIIIVFVAPVAMIVPIGTLCVGLGMSSVYSLQVSNATAFAQRESIKIPGWLFTCGSIGGATLPWLFGVLAERTSLRAAFLLPISTLIILMISNPRTDPISQQL